MGVLQGRAGMTRGVAKKLEGRRTRRTARPERVTAPYPNPERLRGAVPK